MSKPLNGDDKHLLRLIRKDEDTYGWTNVSDLLWPFATELPPELVILDEKKHKIRLTETGNAVLDWLDAF